MTLGQVATLTFVCGSALLACSFKGASPGGPEDPDGGELSYDSGTRDSTATCPWGERLFFDPCGADNAEFPGASPGATSVVGSVAFNTSTGTFESGNVVGLTHRPITIAGDEIYLWLVDDFNVLPNAVLEFRGARPILIAAYGSVVVAGDVAVGSRWDQNGVEPFGGIYVAGAGAATGCAGTDGVGDTGGAGGGGGGGFGGDGGAGGAGGIGTYDGGSGGPTISLSTLSALRGGCGGGRGGASGTGTVAAESPGGGAILFSAVGTFELASTGRVSANGAGGLGQLRAERNGGGGGGSGGLIAVQSSLTSVSGELFANGGGGGGGANDFEMATLEERASLIGQDGQSAVVSASGATGEQPPEFDGGGAGGFLGDVAQVGEVGVRGGGGGGGGVGIVVLVATSPEGVVGQPSAASPAPLVTDTDLNTP